ncbi:unnamed protein product [Diplocarpon coronariae]
MLSLSTAEASLILWALVGCAAAQQLREKIDRLPVGGRRYISDAAASAGCSTDDFGCRCRRPDTVMLGGVAAGESCRVPHGGIPRTADPPGLRSPICEIGHGAAAAPVPTPRADAAAAGLSVAAATASALTAGAEAPAPTPPDPATTTFQTIRTSMPSPTRITPTAFGSILSALLAAGGPAGERAPSSMAALALAPYVSAPGAPPAASLLPTLAPPSMRPASPAEAPPSDLVPILIKQARTLSAVAVSSIVVGAGVLLALAVGALVGVRRRVAARPRRGAARASSRRSGEEITIYLDLQTAKSGQASEPAPAGRDR